MDMTRLKKHQLVAIATLSQEWSEDSSLSKGQKDAYLQLHDMASVLSMGGRDIEGNEEVI